jgi:hypothetical protein
MELLNQEFEKIKESNNPETINDFLNRLSENPNEESLKFIDYFINETEKSMYEKIKLNLVYILGEIGSLTKIADDYLQKLINIYYTSDRWVRNETIQAINKISKNSKLNESIIGLLGSALNDTYLPVKLSALEVLRNFKIFPNSILRNFFQVLNSKESEILDFCRRLLERVLLETQSIFESLNSSDNYKILKTRAIRSLLFIKFKSIFNLELFREKIFNSGWDNSFKENYLKQIDTFQRILVKNL